MQYFVCRFCHPVGSGDTATAASAAAAAAAVPHCIEYFIYLFFFGLFSHSFAEHFLATWWRTSEQVCALSVRVREASVYDNNMKENHFLNLIFLYFFYFFSFLFSSISICR